MNSKIEGKEYDKEFGHLLHHYQLCAQSIDGFVGLDQFMAQYNLTHCQSAKMLLTQGKSNYRGEETDKNLAQRVFDITTKFMQPIDMLTLEIKSIDEISPSLRDVHQALLNYPKLPADYQGLQTIQRWVDKVSTMKASDSLSDDDARQLKFDLETAMQRFNDVVLKGIWSILYIRFNSLA